MIETKTGLLEVQVEGISQDILEFSPLKFCIDLEELDVPVAENKLLLAAMDSNAHSPNGIETAV